MTSRAPLASPFVAGCILLLLAGCANRLAFGTATKFALDISQRPDQTVEMSVGYDRMEVVVIPATKQDTSGNQTSPVQDATKTRDTYSVIGTFQVKHGNPFAGEDLYIHQFFATGRAAVAASKNSVFRTRFGAVAGDIYGQGKTEAEAENGTSK